MPAMQPSFITTPPQQLPVCPIHAPTAPDAPHLPTTPSRTTQPRTLNRTLNTTDPRPASHAHHSHPYKPRSCRGDIRNCACMPLMHVLIAGH